MTEASRVTSSLNLPLSGALVRYFNPYRLAAYLLFVCALAHTLRAVIATPNFGPESNAVVATMKSVHIVVQGIDDTWYGFYQGFGWIVTLFFALSIVVAWHVGGKAPRDRLALAPLTWSLFLSHAAAAVIAFAYFFTVPILFSTVITALFGIGCLRDWLASPARPASIRAN